MAPTILRDYHVNLLDTMRGMSNSFKWWTAPLNLGGSSGADGGSGVPAGGVYGQLPQGKVAYDTTEDSYSGYYDAANPSLLDNLAHLRYDVDLLSGIGGGVSSVQEDGVEIVSDATILNFDAEFDISDGGDGEAIIGYGTLLRQVEERDNYLEGTIQTHWRETGGEASEGITIGFHNGTWSVGGEETYQIRLTGTNFDQRGYLVVGDRSASAYYRDRFIDVDGDFSPIYITDRYFGIISTPSITPIASGVGTLAGLYGRADVDMTHLSPASGVALYAATPRYNEDDDDWRGRFDKIYGLYVEDQNVGTYEGYAIYTNLGLVSLGDTLDMRQNEITNMGTFSMWAAGGLAIQTWDGTTVELDKPFKPSQILVAQISDAEPGTTYAGQVWVDSDG